jgi:sarcosine oxidase subunit gamma
VPDSDAPSIIAYAGAVTLRSGPDLGRLILRGNATHLSAPVASAFGSAIPQTACRAAEAGDRAALWLGPDEWLLLAPPAALVEVQRTLAAALSSIPHALVDVSHRQAAMLAEGSRAADVLNVGCPLDLDARAFPVGMCTRTLLAKAEIVLWRRAAERWHIEVQRSFTRYAWDFLAEAAREYAASSSAA